MTGFAGQRREEVQGLLLDRAEADPRVRGAAITGSAASGHEDRWSDVDLFFGVESVAEALHDWSDHLYADFGALHHFDLAAGSARYRAFLLPDLLEVDLGFAPAHEWGPLGDGGFQVLFGQPAPRVTAQVDRDHLIGLAWHHVVHARVALERGALWQALHWVNALRDHVLTLACLRYSLPSAYGKGAQLLPNEATQPLEAAIPAALTTPALARALAAATEALAVAVRQADPALAQRLIPVLASKGPSPQR